MRCGANSAIFVAENFCAKGLNRRSLLPGVRRQVSFAASVLEEGIPVPLMLDCDLWQQQAAAPVLTDEQSVSSDFDGIGVD